MKNFKLLLATAVLFAVGSAFTNVNKHDDRPVYGNTPSGWVVADDNDECIGEPTPPCKVLMKNDDPAQGIEQVLDYGNFVPN
ncbi:DUF6520 family protein [Chryseobacterium sp. ERMR1:04]|uniref:DUF6520 family protein n=1 Tax=Chryseobacterium sp. ERMR1:04 TaxID=1705393 RepID=UPI0006C88F29|nr:DUF6520 family protein [Chryseobacterium sp. ERMR1:04]KPH13357.1 hypothetical protein AMQ68_13010 [Chryseobacterium sp. ERMR1:04]